MPLPNYGYYNKEKKEKQQFKYEMAPEYVDVEDEDSLRGSGRKDSRKKGRVTTGMFILNFDPYESWATLVLKYLRLFHDFCN